MASRPRADGSAGAPNPGTSWEASSEMKEVKRDGGPEADGDRTACRGSVRVKRRQRGRCGAMRSGPNACRSMPARPAKEVSTGTN